MKKTIKLIGTIAFIALIAFAMSCGDGSGGGKSNTTGDIFDVIVPVGFPATADFSYTWHNGGIVPLNTVIDGEASVIISGGKVNISLGTPKFSVMESIKEEFNGSGITVSPIDAKWFSVGFTTSDEMYCLYCKKDADNDIDGLTYVDKDVTIKGTDIHGGLWNASLKRGWNYGIESSVPVTASTTLPSGFIWTVEKL